MGGGIVSPLLLYGVTISFVTPTPESLGRYAPSFPTRPRNRGQEGETEWQENWGKKLARTRGKTAAQNHGAETLSVKLLTFIEMNAIIAPHGLVVELVDALDSKSSSERSVGSIPTKATTIQIPFGI